MKDVYRFVYFLISSLLNSISSRTCFFA